MTFDEPGWKEHQTLNQTYSTLNSTSQSSAFEGQMFVRQCADLKEKFRQNLQKKFTQQNQRYGALQKEKTKTLEIHQHHDSVEAQDMLLQKFSQPLQR
jgi:hypothetical protein